MALHDHQTTHGVFPAGKLAANNVVDAACDPEEIAVEDNPTACTEHQSWTVECLPFFGEQRLADQYQPVRAWSSLKNRPAVSALLDIFRCPSSPAVKRVDEYHVRGAAATDYGTIFLVERRVYTDVLGVPDPGMRARQGALAAYTKNAPKHITDGLSKTIMVAESAGRPGSYVLGSHMSSAQFAEYEDDEIVEINGNYTAVDGIGWADPDAGFDVKGVMENGVERYGPRMINATNAGEAYSFHNRGAHFLFADGSVQSHTIDIDVQVYVAFCTRAGGEFVEVR